MAENEDPPADDKPTGDPAPKTDPPAKPDTGNAEVEKWKALSRKHEAQAKDNAGAAARLKEIEDAAKSETQRLTDDLTGHKTRADQAEGALRKLQVALDKAPDGMPLKRVRALAARLHGDTVEDLEADAEELFADFAPTKATDGEPDGEKKTDPVPVPKRPREQYRGGGGDPTEEPEESDPAKLAALVPRAR
jgi:hypothetical protein